MQRAWRPYLLVGSLVVGGYFLLPNRATQNIVFDVVGLVGVGAVFVGLRLHRPEHRSLWWLLAVGNLLFVAGDTIWTIYEEVLHVEAPFPSAADVFYLGGYPFLAWGLIRLVRQRTPGADRASLIDATIIAVGVGLLTWEFLIRPYADAPDLTTLEQAISAAYPVMDLLLVVVAARLAVSPGVRVPAYYLLGASLVLLFVSDAAYLYSLVAATSYDTGSLTDAGWMLSYLLLGGAALHPSMTRLTQRDQVRASRYSGWRIALLGAASLAAPAVLAIQYVRDETIDAPLIVAGCAVLFLLVLARMAGLFREATGTAEELAFQSSTLRATLGELRSIEAERRRLLDRSLSATDEERRRIADELHDGPIQRLATLQYGFERAGRQLERGASESAAALLGDLTRQLSGETDSLRRLMAELRPPALDESGLVGALHDQVAGFERQSQVEAALETEVEGRLDPELEAVLYRVVQEALTNVAKHARAQHVLVTLRAEEGTVELVVSDDGVGFDRQAASGMARNGHLGLVAMRERVEMAGGAWRVESAPNEGTRVRVRFEKAKVR
jgi:signal transduction histidine kinase